MAASEVELAMLAMRLGELAAIRSEEYAVVHPEEIARRRLFFRRLLEECRRRECADAAVGMNGSAKSTRSLWQNTYALIVCRGIKKGERYVWRRW